MKIEQGLSKTDLINYYRGTYVLLGEEPFLINTATLSEVSGHVLRDKVWAPQTVSLEQLELCYPSEGYIPYKKQVLELTQHISRTRRKGYTGDNYSLVTVGRGEIGPSRISTEVLSLLFSEKKVSYEEGLSLLKEKQRTGVVLSKQVAITKEKGGRRTVNIRGVQVGNISKEGLILRKEYKMFEKELREHGVPIGK